jgi:hypothetical protein
VAAAWATASPAGAANGLEGPPAPADTTLLAQAESGTASAGVRSGTPPPAAAPAGDATGESSTGFTVRRVANPAYRALTAPVAAIGHPLGTLIGSQYARAQVTRRLSGPDGGSLDWEVAAGRQRGTRSGLEVWAQGYSSPQYDQLRMLRLSALQGPVEWSLGDVAAQPIGTLPWIQRLRGGSLIHALPRGSDWRLLGGVVPTLSHNVTPNTALASFLVEGLPMEGGAFAWGLMGFGRRAATAPAGIAVDPDSLAGGGGAALYSAHVAAPVGDVSTTFMAQLHNLNGNLAPAGIEAIDWLFRRRTVMIAMRDQVGTSNARQPGTDRLSVAPAHEGRLNAQLRTSDGRAELHVAGLASSGETSDLAAREVQAGLSGNLGTSGWYAGYDFTWDRRAPVLADERRMAIQTGRVSARGNSVLLRVERDADNLGRDQIEFTGEAAATPAAGVRFALEPRAEWQAQQLDRGMCSARVGWPLPGPAVRMNASVTVSAERASGFRGELAEATLSLSIAPRPRDRALVEARRYEESGVRTTEYAAGYDLQSDLYSNPASTLADQRNGTLVVTVARSDSSSGVPDVLVSLDGKDFRFTDSEGVARFTDAAAGSHVLSIVERSLPANYKVVGSATVFITIERGRTPEPVRFEVGRPVRKVSF